jgi:ppGpp synthetase/RelA/SpoT-type nucleotidyltranferase
LELESVIDQYEESYALFDEFTGKLWDLLQTLLGPILDTRFILEARTKKPEDLRRKISQPDKHYDDPLKQVHDLSGLRIILHHHSDASRVIELIKKEFDVDTEESWYGADQRDPERFGYLAEAHLIVNIGNIRSSLQEWKKYSSLKAEIQVRTILQHGWDVISHRYDYKAREDIPKETRRRLFRLSALIELADDQIDIFAKEAEEIVQRYERSLNRGDMLIEINVDSLRTYVETSDEVRYWNDFLRNEIGVNVETWGDLSRDVRVAKFCGLKLIGDVEGILREAHGWGEAFLRDYYQRIIKTYGVGNPALLTVVVNGVVMMFLVAYFETKFTAQTLEKDWGYGTVYILDAAREAKNRKRVR